MRPSTALILVLVCAGVAFVAGWFFKSGPEAAAPETTPPAASPQPDAEAGAPEAELASTRAALADEQGRRRRLEEERDHLLRELAARKAAAEGSREGPEEAAGSHEPRYRYAGFEKALTAIDWTKSAEAVVNLAALLGEWGAELEKGNQLPPSLGKIQRWNGPLVSAAFAAQNNGVPGTGVNGAFSHPSVMANLVQATLAEAGHPLDAQQEKRLQDLGRRYVDEDARRLAGYSEGTFALQKTIEEAALKDRFYADVDRLLRTVQRAILHPESTRGRLSLDLFSSGIIWHTMAQPAPYATREELVRDLVRRATGHFGLEAEHKDAVEEAARQWGGGFSQDYLDEKPDALTRAGRFRIERVNVAARRQLVFYKALVDRLPPDAPAAAKVRAETGILLPLRRE